MISYICSRTLVAKLLGESDRPSDSAKKKSPRRPAESVLTPEPEMSLHLWPKHQSIHTSIIVWPALQFNHRAVISPFPLFFFFLNSAYINSFWTQTRLIQLKSQFQSPPHPGLVLWDEDIETEMKNFSLAEDIRCLLTQPCKQRK